MWRLSNFTSGNAYAESTNYATSKNQLAFQGVQQVTWRIVAKKGYELMTCANLQHIALALDKDWGSN